MTVVAETTRPVLSGDALARHNARILSVAQALGNAHNIILIASASIVGAMLAPSASLATCR